jgi:hypothetical protein
VHGIASVIDQWDDGCVAAQAVRCETVLKLCCGSLGPGASGTWMKLNGAAAERGWTDAGDHQCSHCSANQTTSCAQWYGGMVPHSKQALHGMHAPWLSTRGGQARCSTHPWREHTCPAARSQWLSQSNNTTADMQGSLALVLHARSPSCRGLDG